MKKLLTLVSLAASALLLSACNSGGEDVENYLTFHIAEQRSSEGLTRTRLTMPRSGVEVIAVDNFFLSQAHLDNVHVAEVAAPDGRKIRGLLFIFNQEGTKILYRETASNRNGMIMMKEKNVPKGLRRIDTTISDGQLFMLVEFPEGTDLQEKAFEYKDGIRIVQEKIAKKKSSVFSAW